MWIAHVVTVSRMPIGLAFACTYGSVAWSLGWIALAAATDVVDGNLARWSRRRGHSQPDIGGWLDPLFDKLFVAIVLATILAHSRDAYVATSVVLIAARELVLVPLIIAYLISGRTIRGLRADPLGKAATVVQLVAITAVIAIPHDALPIAAAAGALGVAATIHYVARQLTQPAPRQA